MYCIYSLYIWVCIYIYVYVCVCVCVCTQHNSWGFVQMDTNSPHWPGPSWLWLPGSPKNQDAAQTLSPSGFPSCSYTVSKGI